MSRTQRLAGLSWVLILAALAGIGQVWAGSHLDSMPPSVKWYLEQMARKDWFVPKKDLPDSQGLRLVGKWGRGPANRVTGRDSLVFMSLGSEVAIFNAADGSDPRVISEIQCRNVTGKMSLRDSFLFVGCNGPVEVYNIANPARPTLVNRTQAAGAEIVVKETLAYLLGVDSFMVFNVANPRDFRLIGACRDSGYAMTVSDGFAYLSDRWGLYVIDATDPTRPRRAATIAGGVEVGAAWIDSGYCYYTVTYPSSSFRIADVSDPYHPSEVGHYDNIGGYDVYKLQFYVYLPGFQILDVSNPSTPAIIGADSLQGDKYGIWTRSPFSYSFVANGYEGLAVVNISDPVHPRTDTTVASASDSRDVSVYGGLACVANFFAGLKIVNIADPSNPLQVGSYDSAGHAPQAQAVAARDSIACLMTGGWSPTGFRVMGLSDPRNPGLLASTAVFNPGMAVVLRDSLAYSAEDSKLEIFSIANPRNPRLVGSCGLADNAGNLFVKDTLVYVTNSGGVQVVNAADPAHPVLVVSHYNLLYSLGICIVDSIAYLGNTYDSLCIWNFADPLHPVHFGSVPIYGAGSSVVVVGGKAYVGCKRMEVIDVSIPTAPRRVGYCPTPEWVRRVSYSAPYFYAACNGGGVCIFETTATGIREQAGATPEHDPGRHLTISPNPARDEIELELPWLGEGIALIELTGISGRKITEDRLPFAAGKAHLVLPCDKMPPGIYFITAKSRTATETTKLVKQ